MESKDREDILRAKKAISPNGLEDQSAEGNSVIGGELPSDGILTEDLPIDALEDKYMDGPDEPGQNVRIMHLNRNPNSKPDIDKPTYR
ncbi:hypothetical protein [Spirosoma flavum]|uniref:Uncharacterized protein n=1 Tax=Spirosoma flavum TaxID=2048557 RepID=A0ABW6AJN4_9BACT